MKNNLGYIFFVGLLTGLCVVTLSVRASSVSECLVKNNVAVDTSKDTFSLKKNNFFHKLKKLFLRKNAKNNRVVSDTSLIVPSEQVTPILIKKRFDSSEKSQKKIIPQRVKIVLAGADRMSLYLPFLQGKRVAVMVNQTSIVYDTNRKSKHLVDTLLALGIHIVAIFAPEHGYKGIVEAGKKIRNTVDSATRIPIISLYGEQEKPSEKDLENVDIVLYDIQDVGVRFYTYISSFQYMLESCIEQDIPLLVLDRPNPNGFYVDGPVLEKKYTSFVGKQPIPIVYGMTIAEYAQMLYQEKGWLSVSVKHRNVHDTSKFSLRIIPCENYTHSTKYALPVPPSPNLPNMQAVYLYPSLCLFEGTSVSVGRGTEYPFQCYGSPYFSDMLFSFSPVSLPESVHPPHVGKICYGYDLREYQCEGNSFFTLKFVLNAYRAMKTDGMHFFLYKSFFHRLYGSDKLYKALSEGKTEADIRKDWEEDIKNFKKIRKKYLIYPDFE